MATGGEINKEEVINILVIQEPVEWKGTENHTSDGKQVTERESGNGGKLSFVNEGLESTAGNLMYHGQSFVVDGHVKSNNATAGIQHPVRPQLKPIGSVVDMSLVNNALPKDDRHMLEVPSSAPSNISISHSLHPSIPLVRCDLSKATTTLSHPTPAATYSSCLHIAVTSHHSTQLYTSVLHRSPSQTSNLSPRVSQSVQHCSPIPSVQQNKATSDPVTPNVETPPDSGYGTPSLDSNRSTNAFFTSTPRSTKVAKGQISSTVGGKVNCKGTKEALNQRFAELYQAMECDSFDESLSEDAKEDEGETSHNSSLRSVQWLKGFPIADSIQPLLNSPPTPKNRKDVTATTTVSINTFAATQPATSVVMAPSLSTQLPLSCLKPLPVIMAPTVPSYLQTKSILSTHATAPMPQLSKQDGATYSNIGDSDSGNGTVSCSCTATSATSGINSNNKDDEHNSRRSRQRKALEELKMNKAERNIGRSKYTGKIFSRPGYSYMDLIKMAMQTSEEGEMTLKEIVSWIEDHFPFFKHEAKDSWKSSIRHNLSLHSDFMKADDKKHGCKWKLCDGLPQPPLHVPAPVEMTSAQSAFLKKVKRNAPQPILPKVNTYALVPIHGLVDPASQIGQGTLPPPPPLIRKPVQILPKPDSCYSSIQETPTQQHQVMHQLLQQPPHLSYPLPSSSHLGMDESSMDTSSQLTSSSSTPCVFQSSDDNSNHAYNFHNFGLEQQQTYHFETGDGMPHADYANAEPNQYHIATEEGEMIEIPQPAGDDDFLNSVVEIRQEDGNNPGEKKIIFVLKDGENNKQQKQTDDFCSDSVSAMSNVPAPVPVPPKEKTRSSKGKSSNGGRKKSKDRNGSRRRGPVLNMQSVLEANNEDRAASDTIGWLMGQDDEIKATHPEIRSNVSDGFTQMKYRAPHSDHLECHMHRALSEHSGSLFLSGNEPIVIDDSPVVEKGSESIHVMDKASSRLHQSSSGNKSNIRDRMAMIKNKNFSDNSYDWLPSKVSDLEESNLRGSESQEGFSFSSCNTPSASQLVFRRLSSSGDQTFTYSSDSLSSNTPQSDVSRSSCHDFSDNSGGHNKLKTRTRSRRKQIHVPLTTENSPKGKLKNNNLSDERGVSPEYTMDLVNDAITNSYVSDIGPSSVISLQGSPTFKTMVRDNKPFNLPSVHDKDIENIFTMGTPIKTSTSEDPPPLPPSLHFLSQFPKSPDFSSLASSSTTSLSNDTTWLTNRISPTVNSVDIANTNVLSPTYGVFPYAHDEIPSFPTALTPNKRNSSDKAACDIHLKSSPSSSHHVPPVVLLNNSPSMDTPPCGMSLHSPISVTTQRGGNFLLQSPFKLHPQPQSQQQILHSPGTDNNPFPTLPLDFFSSFLHIPNSSSSIITPTTTQQTSPNSSTLTTPPNHFLQVSPPQSVQQELFPFQDNLSTMLDSSMMEHLDLFLNNLDPALLPGLHLSPH